MDIETLLEKVRKAERLPSLPAVTLEVLRLLSRDDIAVDKLIDLIKRDPALAALILKVVNSSFYSLPRKVTSLKQATTVIGISTLKLLVVSVSLVGNLRGVRQAHADQAAYWRRSLFTAVSALLLAKQAAPEISEEAFLTGLLSDIGIMAASFCAPDEYLPVLEHWRRKGGALADIEKEELGVTHARLGLELLQSWNLPEAFCQVVAAHTGEGLAELPEPQQKLARTVRAASRIAELFAGDIKPSEMPRVRDFCCEQTGVEPVVLEGALKALSSHVNDLASLLSLQIGQVPSYAQIEAGAKG